jgi:hypothetical protein
MHPPSAWTPFEKENDLMSSTQQIDNIYPPLEGYFGEGEQRWVNAIKFRYQSPGSSNALFAVICSDTSLSQSRDLPTRFSTLPLAVMSGCKFSFPST